MISLEDTKKDPCDKIKRILILDDSLSDLALLSGVLKKTKQDIEVICCTVPEDAIKLLTDPSEDIDAALIDYHLGNTIDGLQVIQKVRITKSEVAIVLITSDNDLELGKNAIKTGANDSLLKDPEKGISAERICESIRQAIFHAAELRGKKEEILIREALEFIDQKSLEDLSLKEELQAILEYVVVEMKEYGTMSNGSIHLIGGTTGNEGKKMELVADMFTHKEQKDACQGLEVTTKSGACICQHVAATGETISCSHSKGHSKHGFWFDWAIDHGHLTTNIPTPRPNTRNIRNILSAKLSEEEVNVIILKVQRSLRDKCGFDNLISYLKTSIEDQSMIEALINELRIGVINVYRRAGQKKDMRGPDVLKAIARVVGRRVDYHRQEAEHDLHEAIWDNTSNSLFEIENDGTLKRANPRFEKMFGISSDKIVGQCFHDTKFLQPQHPRSISPKKFMEDIWEEVQKNGFAEYTEQLRKNNGQLFWATTRVKRIPGNRYYISVIDVNEREDKANTDGLTGLTGRKLFEHRLHNAFNVGRRHGERLALLFIDINFLKWINDTYGHIIADKVLVQIARRLKKIINREGDVLARYGGDEITVLLSDVLSEDRRKNPKDGKPGKRFCDDLEKTAIEHQNVEIVLSQILNAFEEPVRIGPHIIPIKLSIGASFCSLAESPEEILKQSDDAMYSAKLKSKGRKIFDKERGHTFDEVNSAKSCFVHYEPGLKPPKAKNEKESRKEQKQQEEERTNKKEKTKKKNGKKRKNKSEKKKKS